MKLGFISIIIGVILCWFSICNYDRDLKEAQRINPNVKVLQYQDYWGQGLGTILFFTGFALIMKHDLKKGS